MLKRIVLDRHTGYAGDRASNEGRHLDNGDIGVGFDKTEKKNILVTTCSNCGDYNWIDLETLIKDVVLSKWISLSSLLFEATKED